MVPSDDKGQREQSVSSPEVSVSGSCATVFNRDLLPAELALKARLEFPQVVPESSQFTPFGGIEPTGKFTCQLRNAAEVVLQKVARVCQRFLAYFGGHFAQYFIAIFLLVEHPKDEPLLLSPRRLPHDQLAGEEDLAWWEVWVGEAVEHGVEGGAADVAAGLADGGEG